MTEIAFSVLAKEAFVSFLKLHDTTPLRFSGTSFTLLDEIFKLLNEMCRIVYSQLMQRRNQDYHQRHTHGKKWPSFM